jgi:hypothetical protein
MKKYERIAKEAEIAKATLDTDIIEYIKLTKEYTSILEKAEALKKKIEANYTLPASQPETLYGNEYCAQKTPMRIHKEIDMKQLAVLLDAAGVDKKTVIITKMVKTVNEKAIKQIIKDNIIPQEAIDKLHSCDYTFRSKFCEIQ